ncbi:hypothetical protein GQ457_07G008350 [Hibiscus cannabinus]
MEAFSLLKYWRGGGTATATTNACVNGNTRSTSIATCTTTIVTAATTHLALDTGDDDEDDGPFFDLEFAVDETEENEANVEDEGSQDSNDDADTNSYGGYSGSGETGLNFTVSNNGGSEPNSSLDSNPPQIRISFLKSAAKVRIFLLRLKKSASNGAVTPKKQAKTKEPNGCIDDTNRFFTVNFKVEEVPLISLFSKDNSNRSHKLQSSDNSVSDVMQRYLKKVKPLYVREKLRFSGPASATPPSMAAQELVSVKATVSTGENQVKRASVPLPAGLKVVCKHLGNKRLASSAVAAAPPAAAANLSKRRDDSLLQQEDGVQSAILHCKRSFNGSRDSLESSSSGD